MASDIEITPHPHSLEDIHSSVPIPRLWWRRFLAFSGPAFMVSVGYMDPGNWGSDMQAGSKYGYRLLWVLLMSNLMAVLLQSLATRLGVVTGRDLAQACREAYSRRTVMMLWLLTEIAIAATDLAEVIGTIIALKLLFGIPYLGGLLIAAADTFLLLALQKRGVRLLEVVTLGLVGVIGVSFFFEIVLCQPDWAAAARGFLPTLAPDDLTGSLYVAIAMLGATVMPHNLYLHSALVQTRAFPQNERGKRLACRYNLVDSLLALNGAFFINAGILLLAAATFTSEVKTLPQAHGILRLVWGTALASVVFAVALLASGQSSTLTGTLAGQIVMEGFMRLRVRPWLRRLLTRAVAIVPALLVVALANQQSVADQLETITAALAGLAAPDPAGATLLAAAGQDVWGMAPVDKRLFDLLVLSQAILSFQLPFAIIPLVQFTSDPQRMGAFASQMWLKASAWICAVIVIGLNVVLIGMQMNDWALDVSKEGGSPWLIYGTVGPIAVLLAAFLGWIGLYPYRKPPEEAPRPPALREPLPPVQYRTIGVAVELEGNDDMVVAQAAALARVHGARLVPIHVVEGLGADIHGAETDNAESRQDRQRMTELVEQLRKDGLAADGVLGYGYPPEELVRIVNEQALDLLVVGTHGHQFLADLALGQTVAPVLHRLTIPVLVVPSTLKDRTSGAG